MGVRSTDDWPAGSMQSLSAPFTTGPFLPKVGRALMRRLLSGRTVPKEQEPRGWAVAPAPAPTGGLSAHPDHPSRKHDVDVRQSFAAAKLFHAPHGGMSRRERRALDRS